MTTESLARAIASAVDFLDFLTRATPVVLVLGGFLAYYYREKIKSILAKSVAKDVEVLKADLNKQIAEHTSKLQRELEAYKVSLIAEAERIKANQDVRKSLALKVAEQRFLAISRLYEAHLGIDTSIGALVGTRQSQDPTDLARYLERKRDLNNRLIKYTEASDGAVLFASQELRTKVMAVRSSANTVMDLRIDCRSEPISAENPDVSNLLVLASDLEDHLRSLLSEFEKA